MPTIVSWLEDSAQRTPERVAVHGIERGTAITRLELLRHCRQVAHVLSARGIGPNDRVALIARNSLEHVVAYIGVMAYGATMCTVDPDMKTQLAGIVSALRPRLVLLDGDHPYDPTSTDAESLQLGRLGQPGASFAGELMRAPDQPVAPVSSPGDTASIFYTSGTEATPKGIVCTFAELEANVEPIADAFGMSSDDRILEFRSLNWMSAQVLSGLAPLCKGATLVLADRFSRSRFFDWIADYDATIATGNPTTINMLLNRPVDVDRGAISHLRFITSSSAPLLVEDWRAFEARYGIPIAQGYGSSETGWIAGSNERARRLGSVGKPLPYQNVSIVDDRGNALPAGEIGAIELGRSPEAAYRQLSADGTLETTATGRIRTGDTGYLDADGFLFHTGRAKDLIIRGGVNIAPLEIDAVLREHAAVAEAATVGVADRIWGEEVVAYVAPRPGTRLDVDSVLEHCRERLSEAKLPKDIVVLDALPKTARGKLDRAALAASWQREHEST